MDRDLARVRLDADLASTLPKETRLRHVSPPALRSLVLPLRAPRGLAARFSRRARPVVGARWRVAERTASVFVLHDRKCASCTAHSAEAFERRLYATSARGRPSR